jgi:hypothetical protein
MRIEARLPISRHIQLYPSGVGELPLRVMNYRFGSRAVRHETIGHAGCIRLDNADVIDLYNRVQVGAKVVVRQASHIS